MANDKDIDLSTMTNPREILPQYREQVQAEIRDTLLRSIGQNAMTEKMETVRIMNQVPHRNTNYIPFSAYPKRGIESTT